MSLLTTFETTSRMSVYPDCMFLDRVRKLALQRKPKELPKTSTLLAIVLPHNVLCQESVFFIVILDCMRNMLPFVASCYLNEHFNNYY